MRPSATGKLIWGANYGAPHLSVLYWCLLFYFWKFIRRKDIYITSLCALSLSAPLSATSSQIESRSKSTLPPLCPPDTLSCLPPLNVSYTPRWGQWEERVVCLCSHMCITAQSSMETQQRGCTSSENHTPSVVFGKSSNDPCKARSLVHIWPVPLRLWWRKSYIWELFFEILYVFVFRGTKTHTVSMYRAETVGEKLSKKLPHINAQAHAYKRLSSCARRNLVAAL